MQASDWIRSKFVAGCSLTDEEWQSILDNNQQAEAFCGMSIEQAKMLLASGKYYGHMYQYQGKRVLISYLDKSTTDKLMWRLAFFSFDKTFVDTNTVAELIIRSIREMMVEQYFGLVAPKAGFVRGIYYYTDLSRVGANFLFDRVLNKITEIFESTNFDQFTEFNKVIEGGKIIFYLTYNGT